jgi:hypothetical protein
VKSLEQQLHEQAEEIRQLRGSGGRSTTAAQKLISDSGLSPDSKARLRKRIPLNEKADVVEAAITAERDVVKAAIAKTASLYESYISLGLSEKEAKIAAGVETAVTSVTEARQQLSDAGKLLGLSDAQAAHFSDI